MASTLFPKICRMKNTSWYSLAHKNTCKICLHRWEDANIQSNVLQLHKGNNAICVHMVKTDCGCLTLTNYACNMHNAAYNQPPHNLQDISSTAGLLHKES